MKIAFTTNGTDWDARIDPRFGRTDYLLFYDEDSKTMSSVDNREIINVEHGAGPKTAQKIFDNGAQVLITGNCHGGNAARTLEHMEPNDYC